MPGVIRESLRLALYCRDGFRCVYCGRQVDFMLTRSNGTHPGLELDHIEPRCWGGQTEPWNLATCCLECNDLKHAKDLDHFIAVAGLDREVILRRIYLARRRRLKRARAKALEIIKTLRLLEEARCPWCETTCEHCFEALVKVRLIGGHNAYVEGGDHSGSEGLLGSEEGRDQASAEAGGERGEGHE